MVSVVQTRLLFIAMDTFNMCHPSYKSVSDGSTAKVFKHIKSERAITGRFFSVQPGTPFTRFTFIQWWKYILLNELRNVCNPPVYTASELRQIVVSDPFDRSEQPRQLKLVELTDWLEALLT